MQLTTKLAVSCFAATLVLTAAAPQADAFWGHHRRANVAYSMPSVPVVVARPVIMSAPVVVGRPVFAPAPVVVGYAPAPAVTYSVAPASYVAPTTTYYAPTTSFYAPTTTYYVPPRFAAPAVSAYYAPSPVVLPAPTIVLP